MKFSAVPATVRVPSVMSWRDAVAYHSGVPRSFLMPG